MKQKELAKKVAQLKAGQLVEIDGLIFSAKRIHPTFHASPCNICNVDCLCDDNIEQVCCELNFLSKSVWYLHLES